ncbi:MAG: hypothetical protein NUK65_11540, partial [Firmicutes bacterium]|nr:hypothetical protein [Bacillota bacterium]
MIILVVSMRPVAAAIESYTIKDTDNIVYQYNFQDMLDSYNRNGLLWEDFDTRMMRAGVYTVYDDKSLLYVDFAALLTAYNSGMDVMDYTESADAKELTMPEVLKQITTGQDGKLTFRDILRSGDIVSAINNASSASEMRQLIVIGTEKLSLDLTDFNALNTYGKNQVGKIVMESRPEGGYENGEAIKLVIEDAISNALTMQQEAVKTINDASTKEGMLTALTSAGNLLEVDVTRVTKLVPEAKETFITIMLEGRPYATAEAIKVAYISALQSVEMTRVITYVDYDYNLTYAIN